MLLSILPRLSRSLKAANPAVGGPWGAAKRASKTGCLGLVLGGVLVAAEPTATERSELLEELRALKARINSLESRLNASPSTPAPKPAEVVSPAPLDLEQRVTKGESKVEKLEKGLDQESAKWEKFREKSDLSSPKAVSEALKSKWYERLRFRGYTQIRYHQLLDSDGPALNVPNDRSVSRTDSFLVRRGRLILSGDLSEHLFLYGQMDFNASPTAGDFSMQMRDLYGDISVDAKKEYRFRLGQSKVPFGWVNLQSSQNRLTLERADALNSAVEGERDIGGYFIWAPEEIRHRFRDLVSKGLKGSGDYGVFSIGAYSGQGLNRSDLNGEPHYLARASYPFKFPNGQFLELGVQAYHGRFVSAVSSITSGGSTFTPTAPVNGVTDQRVGLSAVLYPQPFGLEVEWNWGESPELSSNYRQIGRGSLQGGYVLANYRIQPFFKGELLPFVRWQHFEGARKFAANAPSERVHELDLGVEWQPWPELELSVQYTRTFQRTNTRIFPYAETENADRIGFQAQWNY